MFDGKVPHWYHFSCFWKVGHSIRHPDVEVDGFSELRWDDQQKVKKTAEAGGVTGACTPGRCRGCPNPQSFLGCGGEGEIFCGSKEKVLQLTPLLFQQRLRDPVLCLVQDISPDA